MVGSHFGPYGGKDESNVSERFDWDVPVDLAKRMGLLYFTGSSYGVPPNSIFQTWLIFIQEWIYLPASRNIRPVSNCSGAYYWAEIREACSP